MESLRQRFKRLNKNVTKWIGAYKQAHDRATSGQSKEDIEKAAQEIYGLVQRDSSQMKIVLKKVVEAQKERGLVRREDLKSTPLLEVLLLHYNVPLEEIQLSLRLKKGKEVATPSYAIPDNFAEAMREMRVTRERECHIQERKIKAAILTPLMGRRDLTPDEEELKRNLLAELFGK